MGTNTLTDKVGGATIAAADINDIHTALKGDFVGRNSSGVAATGQRNGTPALPWLEGHFTNIFIGGSAFVPNAVSTSRNGIISGLTRTTSNQPQYVVPNGAAASVQVQGLATNLVYNINGSQFTLSANLTASSLTVAPSTNNTALVNDTDAADQDLTRQWGEPYGEKRSITIDAAGSEITALIGTYQAFSINNGSDTEYFLAYIESATELRNVFRGFFYNSSLAPVNRIVFTDNDTITLLSLGWIFLEDDALTLDVTYTNPVWSGTEPSSPATGDYWLDLTTNTWKRYNGASFVQIDRTFVGYVVLDTTNAIAARSVEFAGEYNKENNIFLRRNGNTIMESRFAYSNVNVLGNDIQFNFSQPSWDITTDLATSADMYDATEQANRRYYLYIDDEGDQIISDIEPYFRPDLLGFYQPHNPWRFIGYVDNVSSNFDGFSAQLGDFTDMEYDSIKTADAVSSTSLPNATYVTVPLNSSTEIGSAITRNSNTLNFHKIGFYEITIHLVSSVTSSVSTSGYNLRIRNTSDAKTFLQMDQFVAGAVAGENLNATLKDVFYMTEIDDDYIFEANRGTGGSTVSIIRFYVFIKRIPQPFVWNNQ